MSDMKIFKNFKTADEKAIAAISVTPFLPYHIAGVILISVLIFALSTHRLNGVFKTKTSLFIPFFTIYTAVIALLFKNLFGFATSFGFLLIMLLGYYLKTVMTEKLYENVLDIFCYASLFASFILIVERLTNGGNRCYGDFFGNLYLSFYINCNYIASAMVAVLLVCVYKILKGKFKPVYVIIALFSALSVFLTGSMFAMAEIFIGLVVMFFCFGKKFISLAALFVAIAGAVMLFAFPAIFPRISELSETVYNRLSIWQTAISEFCKTPIFGRGFFTYYTVALNDPAVYFTTHAHNIVIEPLLSFGIVGATAFYFYFFITFKNIISVSRKISKPIFCLTVSLLIGALAHSFIDMTFLWHQTAIIYCLIFSFAKNFTTSEVLK